MPNDNVTLHHILIKWRINSLHSTWGCWASNFPTLRRKTLWGPNTEICYCSALCFKLQLHSLMTSHDFTSALLSDIRPPLTENHVFTLELSQCSSRTLMFNCVCPSECKAGNVSSAARSAVRWHTVGAVHLWKGHPSVLSGLMDVESGSDSFKDVSDLLRESSEILLHLIAMHLIRTDIFLSIFKPFKVRTKKKEPWKKFVTP